MLSSRNSDKICQIIIGNMNSREIENTVLQFRIAFTESNNVLPDEYFCKYVSKIIRYENIYSIKYLTAIFTCFDRCDMEHKSRSVTSVFVDNNEHRFFCDRCLNAICKFSFKLRSEICSAKFEDISNKFIIFRSFDAINVDSIKLIFFILTLKI